VVMVTVGNGGDGGGGGDDDDADDDGDDAHDDRKPIKTSLSSWAGPDTAFRAKGQPVNAFKSHLSAAGRSFVFSACCLSVLAVRSVFEFATLAAGPTQKLRRSLRGGASQAELPRHQRACSSFVCGQLAAAPGHTESPSHEPAVPVHLPQAGLRAAFAVLNLVKLQ